MDKQINIAEYTWAILPSALQEFSLSDETRNEVGSRVRLPRVDDQVAIIPIQGMITQRGEFGDFGTATQGLEASFQRAVDSDRIKAIVLDVDSPGGTVNGVEMASDRIFAARGSKPIVAVANSEAASAAIWLSSSAESFVAAPGAEVGSIGAFRVHEDISGMLSNEGVNITLISRPEFKTEANPFEPLSPEALAFHQDQVDNTFSTFNKTMARNRGVTESVAREAFGKGRMMKGPVAAKAGLIDRVASLPKVLGELGVGRGKASASVMAYDQGLTEELQALYSTDFIEPQVTRNLAIKREARRLRLRELDNSA
jgi:capsid assembly protease